MLKEARSRGANRAAVGTGAWAKSVFHDAFYPGERVQLRKVYGERSPLVVVAGSDHHRKNWCGLDFRAIKRIWAKEHCRTANLNASKITRLERVRSRCA